MPNPPDWIIRIPDQVTVGGGSGWHDCLFVVPLMEWHSHLGTMHGVPSQSWSQVQYRDDGANRYFTVALGNNCVNIDIWWRGWGRCHEDRALCYVDYHPSYACVSVDARRENAFVPILSIRDTLTPPMFDQITAAIARVIDDSYDYAALCAALQGTNDEP